MEGGGAKILNNVSLHANIKAYLHSKFELNEPHVGLCAKIILTEDNKPHIGSANVWFIVFS